MELIHPITTSLIQKNTTLNQIILASQSPRRKNLLSQINLTFIIHPSSLNEDFDPANEPGTIVENLASLKAMDVAANYASALTIGADTIVVYDDEILGKPVDESDAFRLLKTLSGNIHQVYSGVCLILTDEDKSVIKRTCFHEITKVTFSELDDQEIWDYIQTGNPMDKAGAYGIQDDWGSLFVSNIEGDYYNVVGFPLHRFYEELKRFAPEYLPRATTEKSESL